MNIDVILKLLILANVVSLLLSIRIFYKVANFDSDVVKFLISGLLSIYALGFFQLEHYLFFQGVSTRIDSIVLTFLTISTQVTFLIIWLISHLKEKMSLKSNDKFMRNNQKSVIYKNNINRKIEKSIPFSVTKIKILNYRKIIDVSSDKTFHKLLSYAVLMIKRELRNKHIDFFYEEGEILIISYATDKSLIQSVAYQVHDRLVQPIKMGEKNFLLQPTMGCSVFFPEIQDADEMLKRVEIACYKARKLGLIIDFYSNQYAQSIHEEVDILNRLVYAIPNLEFELYYQPIVNSIDKTIHGYEALIRWPQDDGSMIPPDKFITIAEKNNYIKGITKWVVSQVTHDVAVLKRENLHFQVHINISTLDLHDDDLYQQLFDLVSGHQLDPSDIILEVTESALMSDVDVAYLMLSKLSELGFYISIDDFGTGFSSLSLLRVLSFNQIKIDQSFIRHMSIGNSDYAIVASTIYLAHSLGCNVVAEGVEDEQLFNDLKDLGCDYIQGYFMSKPMELTNMIHWSLKQIEKKKLSAIA